MAGQREKEKDVSSLGLASKKRSLIYHYFPRDVLCLEQTIGIYPGYVRIPIIY